MTHHRASALLTAVAVTALLMMPSLKTATAESVGQPQVHAESSVGSPTADIGKAAGSILKPDQIERLLSQAYSALDEGDLVMAHMLAEAAAEVSIPAKEFEKTSRQILRVIEKSTLRKTELSDRAEEKLRRTAAVTTAREAKSRAIRETNAAAAREKKASVASSTNGISTPVRIAELDDSFFPNDNLAKDPAVLDVEPPSELFPNDAGVGTRANSLPATVVEAGVSSDVPKQAEPVIILVSAEEPARLDLPFGSVADIDIRRAVVVSPLSEGEDPQLSGPKNLAQEINKKHGQIKNWEATQGYSFRPNRSTYPFTHHPLYFEDPNLERCGTSYGLLTELRSAGLFFGRIPALPYMVAAECPEECVRSKGDCPSCHEFDLDAYFPEFNLSSVSLQSAAVVGLIFLVP